ncbi:hypothetical protein GCM10009007_09070 [Formosimonas limnophila]|uniref:Peptidase M48 domain-containing protein n=1 Tax=Formosimonas limnophila TaxID=1384487 RepID=A0A8J3CH23_9BURK|nr:M48 family metallopeptidase [Formosimonas limnophila]GHA70498.1 hypothetical protein GCM10009007_09070 [Formosimonas limnophila]
MIFNICSAIIAVLVSIIVVVFITKPFLNEELPRLSVELYLSSFDENTQVPEADKVNLLHGQWAIKNDSSKQTLILSENGNASSTNNNNELSERYIHWKVVDNFLIMTKLSPQIGKVTEEAWLIKQQKPNQITILFNNQLLVADRDLQNSITELLPILTNDKDDGFILSFLIDKANIMMAFCGIVGFLILCYIAQYMTYLSTQVRSIQITKEQFPRAYAIFEEMARTMGMTTIPEFYLANGNGVYNAYASCVSGYRKFACIHAEILYAFEVGGDEQAFRTVMAHELGHIKLGHTGFWATCMSLLFSLPGINLLAKAWGRAFEYEADRMALHFVKGEDAAKSMLMLYSSAFVYKQINVQEYREKSKRYEQMGLMFNNITSSHPIGPWRIDALCNHCQGGLFHHKIEPQGTPASEQNKKLFAINKSISRSS